MKFWPARSNKKSELISDLDAILVTEVSFKLQGKVHIIKPITTETFLNFSNAYAHIWHMSQENKFTNEELIEAYIKVFSSVCETIKPSDVRRMEISQVAGLFQLIIETVTGKAQANEKKTLQKMLSAAALKDSRSTGQGQSPKPV